MLDTRLIAHVERSGFDEPASVIHLFIGGSELHGAKVGTTDDLDLYGVFVGEPADVMGLRERSHFVWSTASDDRRNGPDDVDLTLYSLRRWAGLAAKGNATALHFLFAQATAVSSPAWLRVQANAGLFLSRRSAEQFLGFADNQMLRISGEKGRGKKGTRPEYECVHGYDSKAAMHCLRLYFECIELMTQGRITLPRPERELLIGVRQGLWTLEQFRAEAMALRTEAERVAAASSLPDKVDLFAVSDLLASVHLQIWADRAAEPSVEVPPQFSERGSRESHRRG
jgi:predicted nucleotidyltransferase